MAQQGRSTQTEQILDWLKAGHALTPLEALERFGCFRLAARIGELREGYPDIKTDFLDLPNGKRVANYSLPQLRGQLDLFKLRDIPVSSTGARVGVRPGLGHSTAVAST